MIDLALLVLHVSLGLFFTVTGFRKTFVPLTQARVQGVFDKHGVPAWAGKLVVWGQFLGGLGLLFGALTQLAAFLLLPIMIGALHMAILPPLKQLHKENHWSQWLTSVLCTPETQMTIILVALTFAGGGAYSLDALVRSWFTMGV